MIFTNLESLKYIKLTPQTLCDQLDPLLPDPCFKIDFFREKLIFIDFVHFVPIEIFAVKIDFEKIFVIFHNADSNEFGRGKALQRHPANMMGSNGPVIARPLL